MTEWTVTVKDRKVVFQPKGTKLDFMFLTIEPDVAMVLGRAFISASYYAKQMVVMGT